MVPEIGPKNSNWFEFVGPVAGTGPRNILLGPSCEQVRGTGPCDQLKINQSLISILSSHNSARWCFKMATPESEQIEQTVAILETACEMLLFVPFVKATVEPTFFVHKK